MTRLLVKAKADINARDEAGYLPVEHAAHDYPAADKETLHILLAHGADPERAYAVLPPMAVFYFKRWLQDRTAE
jgi:ankyrin repeat protein